MRWTALIVFLAIAVGTTTTIGVTCSAMGWTVQSAAWLLLVPIAMWAPAFARFVITRRIDRTFRAPFPLSHWGATGAQVVLRPLAIPLIIFASSYAIAYAAGYARWSPGGGKWTTTHQIALNLVLNLAILSVVGTSTALGEELGWRGYLQPRLDRAGVRASVVIVWLSQLAYHAPLMLGADYVDVGGFWPSVTVFALGDLPMAFIIAHEAYRARSLWPAVFLHSFHNTISQYLFPRLFAVGPGQMWLQGESGILPMLGYLAVGAVIYVRMRAGGLSWQQLADTAMANGRRNRS
jgi:membrane protease YdiL (CAAX protease family)